MVEVTATLDGAASAAFNAALKELATSLGDASASAPQRAAIQICKSFRAGTKVAKKNKGMTAVVSEVSPQWITYKDGKKLSKPLRRWTVTLTDRGKTFTRFVYAGTLAEMKKELRTQVGTNYYPDERKGGTRGLAKRSWGWVMHNIFKGASPDTPWQRRKNDRRNPKDATSESYSVAHKGVAMSSGMARICNRLDYIRNALTRSEDEVLDKATSAIVKTLATKRIRQTQSGMSAKEIRAAAEEIKQEFVRQFQ